MKDNLFVLKWKTTSFFFNEDNQCFEMEDDLIFLKWKPTFFINLSVCLFGSSEQENSEQRKVQRELGNDWVP